MAAVRDRAANIEDAIAVGDETDHDADSSAAEPLLQRQNSHDERPPEDASEAPSPWRPSRATRVPMMVYLILLMVLLELEESMQSVPTVRLYESAVCQQYYKDKVSEDKCKIRKIQQTLAHVRGWQGFFDALPTLLLSIPFGCLADAKGRRLVLFLSEFGEICRLSWILMTCMLWDKLPISIVWLSSLFRFIGGGPNVSFAVLLSMVADISTSETRSRTFYFMFCSMLCVGVFGPILAAVTLGHSLWLPYLICVTSLAASFPILYLMPETLHDSSKQQKPIFHAVDASLNPFRWLRGSIKSSLEIYKAVLNDRRMVAGIFCVFLAQFKSATTDILPPYISYKFHWALSKTAVLITVIYSVNVVVFLVVLPYTSTYLKRVTTLPATGIDLLVSRTSLALLSAGVFIVGFANSIGFMFLGLAVFAAGFGARLSMLSVLTGFATAEFRARLYTLLSIIEELTRLISTPLIQNLWAKAIGWDGVLLGLPFIVLSVSLLLYVVDYR
ncbi:major facilitator superfamily domain containing protein [Elaphomyces granulatus]